MSNWYAVYTRPRCERKVAEGFSKRKWQSYCPLHKTGRTSWAGLKTATPVLFPSYVFVRLEREQLWEVKKVEGVINPGCIPRPVFRAKREFGTPEVRTVFFRRDEVVEGSRRLYVGFADVRPLGADVAACRRGYLRHADGS